MRFGDTLRLEAAGPNLWSGEADRNWAHPGGRFGGWTAAMLLRAAILEPNGDGPERGEPLSLTVLFSDPVTDGPIEIATRCLRVGNRIQFWRSELRQGGKVCAHAQITFGMRRPSLMRTEMKAPTLRPPGDPGLVSGSPPTAFGRQLEALWETAYPFNLDWKLHPEGFPSRSLAWVRQTGGAEMDACLLAALADFAPPRTIYMQPVFTPSSTVSMNVYFHATPEEIAAVGASPIASEVVCRRCEGGYFDHALTLWSPSGALLATSEQIAAFRG